MFYSMQYNTFGAAADAAAAEGAAREARTDVELLKHDVNRVLLITEALWTFLKRQHGYSDDDLRNLIQEIDLRDGKSDGQTGKEQPLQCSGCGRVNSAKRAYCIYCGKALTGNPFAR